MIQYHDPPTLLQTLLTSKSQVGGALMAGKLDGGGGVSITVDQNLLREMTTPRPMYLWRGQ